MTVPGALPDLQTSTATLADGRMMVTRRVHASVDQVWAVLADGWRYATWATGAIREVDREWPAVGSRLRHRTGAWPIAVDGHVEVLACQPGRQVVLGTRAWPTGTARLRIMVNANASHGSTVRIAEDGTGGAAGLVPRRFLDRFLVSRHRETLRRLAMVAEGQHGLEQRQLIQGTGRAPEPALGRRIG